MAKKEKSGKTAGQLASKALRAPGSLSEAEIKTIAASVLSQRPDKPKSASKSKHPGIYPPPKEKVNDL